MAKSLEMPCLRRLLGETLERMRQGGVTITAASAVVGFCVRLRTDRIFRGEPYSQEICVVLWHRERLNHPTHRFMKPQAYNERQSGFKSASPNSSLVPSRSIIQLPAPLSS